MFKKIYFDSLPSTNTYLKENYHKYDNKDVIIAGKQLQGRGRREKNWITEAGKDIAMSILLKPKVAENISLLSLLTSAAIFNVIKDYGLDAKIKWPNDILVNDKKISGILLESVYKLNFEAVIIGIGINVNSTNFPTEILNKATSLKRELSKDLDIDTVINKVLKSFASYYGQYEKGENDYIKVCRENSAVIGKEILINNHKVRVENILDNGNLLVNDGNKSFTYAYGEISLENIY